MNESWSSLLAGLLRCRRQLQPVLKRVFDALYPQDVDMDAWRRFEAQQLHDSASFMLFVYCFWLPGMGMATNFAVFSGSGSPFVFMQGENSVLFVATFILLWCAFQNKGKDCSTTALFDVLSCCLAFNTFIVNALASCMVSDEVIAHRGFLFKLVSLLALASQGSLPMRWHIAAISIPAWVAWMLFHSIMGYFPNIAAVFAGTFLVATTTFMKATFYKSRWDRFRSMEGERHARLLSDVHLEAFQGVLNVMCDATCTCDEAGRIRNSSQHFPTLLGICEDDLGEVDLMQLAVNSTEGHRVETFLRQVLSQWDGTSPRHASPMAVLGTVLKCSDSELKNRLNVKLYCVALPVDCKVGLSTSGKEPQAQRLFVGLQVVELPEMMALCCSYEQYEQQYEPFLDFSPPGSHTDIDAEVDDDVKPDVASEYDDDEEETRLAEVVHGAPLIKPEHGDEQESEISFAYSASTRARICDVAAQTNTSFNHLVNLAMEADWVQAGHQLPPISEVDNLVPWNETPVSSTSMHCKGIQTDEPKVHAKPPSLHFVDLRTKKCFHRKFKETSKETIDKMILELLMQMNLRGKGCCFRHIGLVTIHRAIAGLIAKGCDRESRPHDSWQCSACGAVNDEDNYEVCLVCGSDNEQDELCMPALGGGLSEGMMADDGESDVLESDSLE